MKMHDYREIEPIEDAPGVLRRVVVGADQGAPNFVMRVFEVEPGSSTPFHSHWWEHEVFVLSGKGVAKGKENERPLAEGTAVFVEPDEQHCFTNTGKDVMRIICVVPLAATTTP